MISIPKFLRLLRAHTREAKHRWGQVDVWGAGDGWSTAEVGQTVLTEEVGKLARCVNKLHIATDEDIKAQWRQELGHRCVTTASVAMRIAEQFADIPKQDYAASQPAAGRRGEKPDLTNIDADEAIGMFE